MVNLWVVSMFVFLLVVVCDVILVLYWYVV